MSHLPRPAEPWVLASLLCFVATEQVRQESSEEEEEFTLENDILRATLTHEGQIKGVRLLEPPKEHGRVAATRPSNRGTHREVDFRYSSRGPSGDIDKKIAGQGPEHERLHRVMMLTDHCDRFYMEQVQAGATVRMKMFAANLALGAGDVESCLRQHGCRVSIDGCYMLLVLYGKERVRVLSGGQALDILQFVEPCSLAVRGPDSEEKSDGEESRARRARNEARRRPFQVVRNGTGGVFLFATAAGLYRQLEARICQPTVVKPDDFRRVRGALAKAIFEPGHCLVGGLSVNPPLHAVRQAWQGPAMMSLGLGSLVRANPAMSEWVNRIWDEQLDYFFVHNHVAVPSQKKFFQACDVLSQKTAGGSWPSNSPHSELLPAQPSKADLVALGRCTRIPAHNSLGVVGVNRFQLCRKTFRLMYPNGREDDDRPEFAIMTGRRELILNVWSDLGLMAATHLADSIERATELRRRFYPLPFSNQAGLLMSSRRGGDRSLAIQRAYAYRFRENEEMSLPDLRAIMDRELDLMYHIQEKAMVTADQILDGTHEQTEAIETEFDGVQISKIGVREGAVEEVLEKAASEISALERQSRREFVKNLMLAAFEDLQPYYDHRQCRDMECHRPDLHLAVYLEPQCFMREGKPRVIGRIWDSAMLFYRFCSNLCGSRFTCRMPGQEAATCSDGPDWDSIEEALASSEEDFDFGNFDASNSTGQMWRSLLAIAEKAHETLSFCYPDEEELLAEVGRVFGSDLSFKGIFELLLSPNRVGVVKEGRMPGLPMQMVHSQDYKSDERLLTAEEWNRLFEIIPTPLADVRFRVPTFKERKISPVDCSYDAKDGVSGLQRGIREILDEYKDDHIFRDLPCTQKMEEIMTSVFRSDVDTLLSAATGTGKTSVIIAAIIRLNAGATVAFAPKILAAMELLRRLMQLFPPADGGPDVDTEEPMGHPTWNRLSCDRIHGVVLGIKFEGSVEPDLDRCTCLVSVPFHSYLDVAMGFPSTVYILDEPDQYRYEATLLHEDAFQKDNLSIVAMSATLDKDVRSWPESELIEVVQDEPNCKPRVVCVASSKWLAQLITELKAREEKHLSVLIFVQTRGAISRIIEYTGRVAQRFALEVVPIHGVMSGPALIAAVKRPLPPGKLARLFIATDIATTAVTLPFVTIVVDDRTREQSIWEPLTTAESLGLRKSSGNTTTQRKGRSARCRYPKGHRHAGMLRPSVYIQVEGCEEGGEVASEVSLTHRTLGVYAKGLPAELTGVHNELSVTFHPLAKGSATRGGLLGLGKSSSVLAKAAAVTLARNRPPTQTRVPHWETDAYVTLPRLSGAAVPKMSEVHSAMFLAVAKFGQVVAVDPDAPFDSQEYMLLVADLRKEAAPLLAFIALSHAQAWGETVPRQYQAGDKDVETAAFMLSKSRICGHDKDKRVNFGVLPAVLDKVDLDRLNNKRLLSAKTRYDRLFAAMFREVDQTRDGLSAEYPTSLEVFRSEMYEHMCAALMDYPTELLVQSPGRVDAKEAPTTITSVWSGDRFAPLCPGFEVESDVPVILLGARPWKRSNHGDLRVACYLPVYGGTDVGQISELKKPEEPIIIPPGESKECYRAKLMCPSAFRDHVLSGTDAKRVFEQFYHRLELASSDLGDLYDSVEGNPLRPEEDCVSPVLVNWLNLANPLTGKFLQANNSAARNMIPYIVENHSEREDLLPADFREALQVLRNYSVRNGSCGFASIGCGDDRTEVYPKGAAVVSRWSVSLGEFVGGPTSTVYAPFRRDMRPVGSSLLFTEEIKCLSPGGVTLEPFEVIKPGTIARTVSSGHSHSFPIDPAVAQDLAPLLPWPSEHKAFSDYDSSDFVVGVTCQGGPPDTAHNRARRNFVRLEATEHLASVGRALNAATQLERRRVPA